MTDFAAHRQWLGKWLSDQQIARLDFPLLLSALTHPSASLDNNYERLEFLGDKVIGHITATDLYHVRPKLNPGQMTEQNKQLTNNEFMASLYDRLGMPPLKTERSYRVQSKDKADAVEAFFAVVSISLGDEVARKLWHVLVPAPKTLDEVKDSDSPKPAPAPAPVQEKKEAGDEKKDDALEPRQLLLKLLGATNHGGRLVQNVTSLLASSSSAARPQQLPLPSPLRPSPYLCDQPTCLQNAKNELQQACQKNRSPVPQYKLVSEFVDALNDHLFVVQVTAHPCGLGKPAIVALGEGKKRKEADMAAAANACDLISLPYVGQRPQVQAPATTADGATTAAVVELDE